MRLRPQVVATAALVVLWLGVSAVLAIWFSGRIRDWSVMTDELLYAKLATSIADTGSPLPRVHGTSIEVYNQLYPLLIAPLYGALSPPEAFRAAHVLNAVVMASAVFPVYLLGRQVLPRAWAVAVAGLCGPRSVDGPHRLRDDGVGCVPGVRVGTPRAALDHRRARARAATSSPSPRSRSPCSRGRSSRCS